MRKVFKVLILLTFPHLLNIAGRFKDIAKFGNKLLTKPLDIKILCVDKYAKLLGIKKEIFYRGTDFIFLSSKIIMGVIITVGPSHSITEFTGICSL
jgi:hypothetical protein